MVLHVSDACALASLVNHVIGVEQQQRSVWLRCCAACMRAIAGALQVGFGLDALLFGVATSITARSGGVGAYDALTAIRLGAFNGSLL